MHREWERKETRAVYKQIFERTNERTMKYSRVKCRWHNYEQSSRKGKRQKKVKNEDGRARKCIIEQHQRDTNRKEEMGRRRPREMLLDVAACCGWVERRRRKVAFFFFFFFWEREKSGIIAVVYLDECQAPPTNVMDRSYFLRDFF